MQREGTEPSRLGATAVDPGSAAGSARRRAGMAAETAEELRAVEAEAPPAGSPGTGGGG